MKDFFSGGGLAAVAVVALFASAAGAQDAGYLCEVANRSGSPAMPKLIAFEPPRNGRSVVADSVTFAASGRSSVARVARDDMIKAVFRWRMGPVPGQSSQRNVSARDRIDSPGTFAQATATLLRGQNRLLVKVRVDGHAGDLTGLGQCRRATNPLRGFAPG